MRGRYLNEGDILNKKHVVIGRLVEQDLFDGKIQWGNILLKVVEAGE